MHREEACGGWLAGTIVWLVPGTVQVSKSQSLINGSLVLAALDLRCKARTCSTEGQNPLSEQPSGHKSFHQKQRRLRQGSWLDRGCESHPPSWVVHGGTRPQQRRREAGLDAEEDEQTGRNESEPHIMSPDISQTGDKPSPSSLGEGRWERVGQQPASAQHSGGVCVDSTSGRQARVTWEDSGDGK